MNYKPKKNQTKQTRPIACRLGKQEQPSPSKKNRRTGKESNCVGEVPNRYYQGEKKQLTK